MTSDPPPDTPHAYPSHYTGFCQACGVHHVFENDAALARHAVRSLFRRIDEDVAFASFKMALQQEPKGKMLGVLVVDGANGALTTLHAYSGRLGAVEPWPGWTPCVWERERTQALELETLARIRSLEAQMRDIDVVGAQTALDRARRSPVDPARFADAKATLLERRRELRALRDARREVSLALGNAWIDSTRLLNRRGDEVPLRELFAGRPLPGGATDCCLPKLLHAAHKQRLRPRALVEVWWGPSVGERAHGEPQLPCVERCEPLLGHLLCGLS